MADDADGTPDGKGVRERSAPADAATELERGPVRSEVDDRGTGHVDRRVPWRIFLSIGFFALFLAVLYGITSQEYAGTSMLVVSALLGLWIGVFLWRTARRVERTIPSEPDRVTGLTYLPEASVWPLGIGLGLALALNGLLIGTWFLIPGATVLAVSIAGFAFQSRWRR
ncbi:MAG: cytochrome oxidase subunit [Acidimicrobiales bacterium]|nr:cytochrome oxidase subunit [Acidimicrobiales bacterium]